MKSRVVLVTCIISLLLVLAACSRPGPAPERSLLPTPTPGPVRPAAVKRYRYYVPFVRNPARGPVAKKGIGIWRSCSEALAVGAGWYYNWGYNVPGCAGLGANLSNAAPTTVVASMGAIATNTITLAASNMGAATGATLYLYIR